MRRFVLFILLTLYAVFLAYQDASAYFDLPTLPPADLYGNLLINRTSEKNSVKPATFSHWSHRLRHTCRVCHLELEFEMKRNTTEITEKDNREGKFCGAKGCHDGQAAFGHSKENCEKCHNGDIGYGKEKFSELNGLPKTGYGNQVNWTKAMRNGSVKPAHSLSAQQADMSFDKLLHLRAEWSNIPPAIFPHKAHTPWLDCSNCHPEIFNIKKKTTKHFSMLLSLEGKFCGVCHLKIAFPMQDCKRCHPGMQH